MYDVDELIDHIRELETKSIDVDENLTNVTLSCTMDANDQVEIGKNRQDGVFIKSFVQCENCEERNEMPGVYLNKDSARKAVSVLMNYINDEDAT